VPGKGGVSRSDLNILETWQFFADNCYTSFVSQQKVLSNNLSILIRYT